MLPRWRAACPACNSAREFWSTQSLSPMVMGRFLVAVPQSPVPPGCRETEPSVKLMRATRDGGSWVSSALGPISPEVTVASFCGPCALTAGDNKNKEAARHSSNAMVLLAVRLAFIAFPLIRNPELTDGSRKPVPIITLIGFPLGRTPKAEISCHWRAWRGVSRPSLVTQYWYSKHLARNLYVRPACLLVLFPYTSDLWAHRRPGRIACK